MGFRSVTTWLGSSFPAMLHKDYRRFWTAMVVSTIGTWMQNIAQPAMAYKLTESPILLGLVGAAQFAPMLLFSLFAGTIIDRFQHRRILIITQTLSMVVTGTFAFLVFTDMIQYWHILLLAFSLGMVNTIDMPARQSFLIELVGKKDLMNAIALNASMFNVSRLIGPAIAGILIATVGIGFCFLYNSLSFGAVVTVLLLTKPKINRIKTGCWPKPREVFSEVAAGIHYIRTNKALKGAIAGAAIIGTFAFNFSVLVPVFSHQVLSKGDQGFAFLMSMMGVGSLCGSITMAIRSKDGLRSYLIPVIGISTGIVLALVGVTRMFPLTALMLACTGFFAVVFNNLTQSTIQMTVEDSFRGRVTSAHTLVNAGTTPFGNLFVGFIAAHYGAPAGFIVSGSIIILLFVFLVWRRLYTVSFPSLKKSRS